MRFFLYITLIAALLVSFVPAQAMLAATVVEPANMNGWLFGQETPGGGHIDFVSGPEPAPLGKGSAHFVLDNGTAGWTMGTALPTRTNLLDLTTLRYSTYVKANNSSQAVALQFDIDYDSEDAITGWQGRLVFDPSIAGTVTKSIWQEWNTIQDSAKWFGSGGAGKAQCPMGTPCTWSDIKTKFPRASVTAISLKAGAGWASLFDGNVDALVIGVSGVDMTFDFEPASIVYVDDNWSAVPYGTDPDGTGPAHLMGFDASATVQGGVNIVATDGMVKVAAGTYTEQVLVNNLDGIIIEGAGEDQVTIKATPNLVSTLTTGSGDNIVYRKPILFVGDSDNVTVKGLTLDGDGSGNTNNRLYGLFYLNSSGLVENVTSKAMRHTPLNGVQGGVGFYIYNTDPADANTVTVRYSTATDYQKGGFVFNGVGLTAIAHSNIATSIGPTSLIAMNGIQFGYGASGTISRNRITGHSYINPPNAQYETTSAGILLYQASAEIGRNEILSNQAGISTDSSAFSAIQNYITGSKYGFDIYNGTADIFANNITSNEFGIQVSTYGNNGTVDAAITHNRFFNNKTGVKNAIEVPAGQTVPTIDAIDNWWSCNEGPNDAAGDCDTTLGPVDTTTWLKLTLSADKTHVLHGSPANLLATLTINSANVDVSGTPGFPVGKDVLFGTTLGEVTPVEAALVEGSAASVLTVDPWANYETATVSVKLDNETVTLDLLAGLRHFWMPIIHTTTD